MSLLNKERCEKNIFVNILGRKEKFIEKKMCIKDYRNVKYR